MDRNRMLVGIGVALIVALLASRYVYQQVRRAAVPPAAVKFGQVVVATLPHGLGDRLDGKDLRVSDWPVGKEPAGSFSRVEDVIGRALITSVVVNEPILEGKLAPREAGAGLPAAIPQGMRAMAIRVDDVVGVAGFTIPGAMVDVLVTGEQGVTGVQNESITKTLLEDIRVMAEGQQVQPDAQGKPQTVTVVTLLVTPEQANRLALASTEGKLHLALRNTIDTKDVNPPAAYSSAMFLGVKPPSAQRVVARPRPVAPPPPAPFVIDVIRGGKVESQSFPGQTGH